ncbi:ribonuclease III [Abyssibacter profundi]|uniref:Ribonuclease 3 n=1 Tax=Abyssibacter profundi TaxID=2182787 RepID=A0A363UKE9_9GAMM|nr:ribonuclease III [Abyssibacter profundi]MBV60546.1 ribonuclease III [Nevskiales bacterium]PWN55857.1 ribonuclease III [Abyssibacter profundi]
MTPTLAALQRAIGYQFNNESLLEQALRHRSAGRQHNERLEFLGDGLLNFVIAAELYQRQPESDEGDLSRIRAALVRGSTLAEIGRELGLGDWMSLGLGEKATGGHRRGSILADAVEALLGAVYLDQGFDAAATMVRRLFAARLDDLPDAESLKDAKTRLQEALQREGRPLPAYEIIEVTGEQHKQHMRATCRLADTDQIFEGQGSSRRKAEQDAARACLEFVFNLVTKP